METAALLDLVMGNEQGLAVGQAIRGHPVHLSDHSSLIAAGALRRLSERGLIAPEEVADRVRLLQAAPFSVHPALSLLGSAVGMSFLRLGDALCMELSRQLAAPLITTDVRLASVWPRCRLISAASVGSGPS